MKLEKIFLLIKALSLIKNFHVYLLDHIGKARGIYTLKLRNGLKVRLRSNTTDRMIFNDIFLREEYPLPKKREKLVVDIGAHIGLFALYIARRAKKVICFEPLKENFEILKENIKINNFKNVALYNWAISKKKGKVRIYVPENNDLSSPSLKRISNKYEIANSLSPKTLLKKFDEIGYLKMDCEGCEFEILPLLDLNKIKFMVTEYHLDKNNKKDFLINILTNKFEIKEKAYKKDLGLFFCERK